MTSTSTGKRLLAARVLLGIALLLTVLAVFLPIDSIDPNPSPFGDSPHSTGFSLSNLHDWWERVFLFCLVYWLGTEGFIGAGGGPIICFFLTSFLLQLSSLWLVRFYHQSRLLCWVARVLALICAGLIAYAIFVGRVWDVGLGIKVWAAADLLLLIGLFLIPHRHHLLPPS